MSESFEDFRILYLEDEPLISMDVTHFLKSLGFAGVTSVARLAAAQAAVAQTRFDVALFDINVDKNQTSIALGDALLAAGTRVIFASGNSSYRAQLLAVGHSFVDKPISYETLHDLLNTILRPPVR